MSGYDYLQCFQIFQLRVQDLEYQLSKYEKVQIDANRDRLNLKQELKKTEEECERLKRYEEQCRELKVVYIPCTWYT